MESSHSALPYSNQPIEAQEDLSDCISSRLRPRKTEHQIWRERRFKMAEKKQLKHICKLL
jgi:hypothetical protein